MLQNAIATNGERVEKHAVDAWIDGRWTEIVASTNIGYRRILRFPEVTTDKLRLRLLESRLIPAIAIFLLIIMQLVHLNCVLNRM